MSGKFSIGNLVKLVIFPSIKPPYLGENNHLHYRDPITYSLKKGINLLLLHCILVMNQCYSSKNRKNRFDRFCAHLWLMPRRKSLKNVSECLVRGRQRREHYTRVVKFKSIFGGCSTLCHCALQNRGPSALLCELLGRLLVLSNFSNPCQLR